MKIALTIVCSLLLVWAQVASASAQPQAQVKMACCPKATCHMPCCKSAPAPTRVPLDATVSVASQQILSPVPATVVWVWAAAGTSSSSFAPSVPPTTQPAPIFARNCLRLI